MKAHRLAFAVPSLMAAVTLSGCAGGADDIGSSVPPSATAPSATPSESGASGPAEGAPASTTTPIVLEIDGQEIAGELDDSPAAASLAAQLPLTLAFDDHGGQEKYAELPEPLDLTGAPQRSDAQPLQIGYYVPDQRLILYYAYVGTFAGIVPIGSYENADPVVRHTEEFTVSIRKAD